MPGHQIDNCHFGDTLEVIARFAKMTFLKPTTPFFGRESELQRLMEVTRKRTASIVVIKGRRRVGKSRLTEELAKRLPGHASAHFQGLPPEKKLTAHEEREDFAQQLSQKMDIPPPRAGDWNVLLWALADRVYMLRIQ